MGTRTEQRGEHDAPANRRLRSWREWRGWTLRQLSHASGIPHGLIGQYERGVVGVSFRAANRLARALGIHVAYLWDVMMPDLPARDLPPPPSGESDREGRNAAPNRPET